jgi:hypothetical protein
MAVFRLKLLHALAPVTGERVCLLYRAASPMAVAFGAIRRRVATSQCIQLQRYGRSDGRQKRREGRNRVSKAGAGPGDFPDAGGKLALKAKCRGAEESYKFVMQFVSTTVRSFKTFCWMFPNNMVNAFALAPP